MVYRFMAVGMAAILSAVTLARLAAQDEASTRDEVAAPVASRPFAEVSAEWEALDQNLNDLIEKYRVAPPQAKAAIVEEYKTMIAKSRALLPELRSAAIAAYQAASNADKKVTETLIGLLANDVRTDHYSDALELGNLLLTHNCEDPAVFGLVGSAAYCLDDFETAAVHLNKGKAANALSQQAASYLDDLELATRSWKRELELRAAEAKADDLPRVRLQTTKGDIVVELLENEAPQAVGNFISLVDAKFYDGLTFHRVLPGFMAQGGCPDGTGGGGPGYQIYCECGEQNHRHHFRGTLSMAHAGKDTGGSQFFLTFRRTAHLDGKHTVFGRVVEGMDVLAKLQRRDPNSGGQPEPDKILKAEILRKRNHEYAPTKVAKQ